jgi:hypothetical protein
MKNSQKTLLIFSISTVVILTASLIIYMKFLKPKEDITPQDPSIPIEDNTPQEEQKEHNFTLATNYLGDNNWEYTITGTLPNPCYEYTIDERVMESYPEQVEIVMNIEQTGDICIQVIQEVEESGNFKASQEAQVSLVVNQKD